jgi:hypothetical protein
MRPKLPRNLWSHWLARTILLLPLAFSAQLCNQADIAGAQTTSTPGTQAKQLAKSQSAEVISPMAFEANRGQATKDIDFLATGPGYAAQVRANSVTLHLRSSPAALNSPRTAAGPTSVRIALSGADPRAEGSAENKLPGYSNYLFGPDLSKWITHVDHFGQVRYRNVYPGIDLLFHGRSNRLEQDFILQPGADPKRIRLHFQGVQRAELNNHGDLVLTTATVPLTMQKPRAYQLVQNKEVDVPIAYHVHNGDASFRLGPYDPLRALTIDPVLVYSTFLGGSQAPPADGPSPMFNNIVTSSAVDASGLYVTGNTGSSSFPVTSGVVQPDQESAFVSKLDPAGQTLIFSTYIAGFEASTVPYFPTLAVDSSGDIFIAGAAAGLGVWGGGAAADLPIPAGSHPFQNAPKGYENLAILKLNNTGTAVLAATYLGGSSWDSFFGLAVDSAENVYVSGTTISNDFPTKNPLQVALGTSGSSSFIAKLNPSLSGLVYSTYLGGNSNVNSHSLGSLNSLALDTAGNVYIAGEATAGFPTTSDAYQPACPSGTNGCPFLAKLKSDGSQLLYATYIGGNSDQAGAVVVDAAGNAYIAGITNSSTFPVVGPIETCGTSPSSNFLSEFSSAGALVFSTCLGVNSNASFGYGPVLALDSSGNVAIAGSAQAGLPLLNPIDANAPTLTRPFVSEVSSSAHTLMFSSFVAGPVTTATDAMSGEAITAISVDPTGNVYLAGSTRGPTLFPVFNPLQPDFLIPLGCETSQCSDGFILKISPSAGAAAALVPAGLTFPPVAVGSTSAAQPVTIYDLGTDALAVSNIVASGDFTIQSNSCASVPASGGSCTLEITFTPTAMGTRSGTVTITDSSAGSPHSVTLTGQGSTANLTASPLSLTFSNQGIGTTSPSQTVTLGAGTLTISTLGIQATGDFAETNNCGAAINAFATCQILVTFTPTAAGARAGTLTITDNAPNSPQTVALTGTGATSSVGLGVASGGSASATVTAGATATYALTIGGSGMSGTASLTCTGTPTGAMCSVPATVLISASTASTFSATVTTTARSLVWFFPGGPTPWLWALAVLGCLVLMRTASATHFPRWRWRFAPVLAVALCACGGGNSTAPPPSNGTSAGAYTIVVTAKSGTTTQTQNLSLTVQ